MLFNSYFICPSFFLVSLALCLEVVYQVIRHTSTLSLNTASSLSYFSALKKEALTLNSLYLVCFLVYFLMPLKLDRKCLQHSSSELIGSKVDLQG
jgi:hypothetical protein